jgi:hypothetical protein
VRSHEATAQPTVPGGGGEVNPQDRVIFARPGRGRPAHRSRPRPGSPGQAKARLLGFTRGECVTGPERGRVLVRSVWRADVELRPWEARFEIADRRVVAPAAVEEALSLGTHPFAAIIRRELREAARRGGPYARENRTCRREQSGESPD